MRIASAAVLVALLSSCYDVNAMLRKRAAADLHCPEGQLQVRKLSAGSQTGVSGCGHVAIYIWSDNHWAPRSIDHKARPDATSAPQTPEPPPSAIAPVKPIGSK